MLSPILTSVLGLVLLLLLCATKDVLVDAVSVKHHQASSSSSSPVQESLRRHRRSKTDSTIRNNNSCPVSFQDGHVLVNKKVWFSLNTACVRHDHQEFCNHQEPIFSFQQKKEAQQQQQQRNGSDPLGSFQEYSQVLNLKAQNNDNDNNNNKRRPTTTTTTTSENSSNKEWEISYKFYPKDDPTTLIFGQHYIDTMNDTAFPASSVQESAEHGISSWFPAFTIIERKYNGSSPMGFMELNGMFMGADDYRIDSIDKLSPTSAKKSGPIVFFDKECIVVISSASSFMTTSSMYRQNNNNTTTNNNGSSEYGFGLLGSVSSVPAGHRLSVILSSSPFLLQPLSSSSRPDSIRQAFSTWGTKLQKLYGTKRAFDPTLDFLQFSTDNGAFYYYNTEAPDKNYQDTILDVREASKRLGLPFRSWLMDSWWYYKGSNDAGVKNWTARPDIFPNGIAYVKQHTKEWNIVAHNRFWSYETDYAKQNGGKYEFVIEGEKALPLEDAFWDDLFQEAKLWGLTVYEQDWLNVQTESMNHTLQTVDGARTWLLQMGNAARRNGIPIQYCMSWPRHMLQSLEIDQVTQARASDDYQPQRDVNWDIGITSMFSYALGIAPYKDNFWSSTAEQPIDRYTYKSETCSRLHSIIATYSRAPVAPSDNMHFWDKDLIMKSCAMDGKLLRPDIPAVRTDASILQEAGMMMMSLPSSERHHHQHQSGQVWTTTTKLSGYAYTYLLSINSTAFDVTRNDLYQSSATRQHQQQQDFVAWNLDSKEEDIQVITNLPFRVPESNITTVQIYCIAPVLSNGWVFLGEAKTKWTAVSQDRFSNFVVIEVGSNSSGKDGFSVSIVGAPGETVELAMLMPHHQQTNDYDEQNKKKKKKKLSTIIWFSCILPSSGRATFYSSQMDCFDEEYAKEKI